MYIYRLGEGAQNSEEVGRKGAGTWRKILVESREAGLQVQAGDLSRRDAGRQGPSRCCCRKCGEKAQRGCAGWPVTGRQAP